MNKTELASAIAEKAEISKKDAEKALKALLESAGFMWEVERSSEDMYEDDTKYYHKTLCFSIERSENG